MRFKQSLRSRVLFSFVLFGGVLSIALSIFLYFSVKSLERTILDDTLEGELEFILQHENAFGDPIELRSRTMALITTPISDASNLPNHLRYLSPGFHNVTRNSRDYRVLIKDAGSTRYFLQLDDTNVHRRERLLFWLHCGAVAMSILLAALMSNLLARRIITPVVRLARDVERLKSDNSGVIQTAEFAEDEVGQLARQFQLYHDQLMDLLEREQEFTANVSHELRTPVTTINLAAEVLMTSRELSRKDRTRVERIQRATREMSELVETFLVLAHVESRAEGEYGSSNVNTIVREVIDNQKMWLQGKKVEVEFRESGQLNVTAPPRVVAVLVSNIVRNSFRYTNKGWVRVNLQGNKLSIEDSGPGMADETKAHIFERHFRGKSGRADGAGLGLSIVSRICHRYGWTISVTSQEGSGSRFEIVFDDKREGADQKLT